MILRYLRWPPLFAVYGDFRWLDNLLTTDCPTAFTVLCGSLGELNSADYLADYGEERTSWMRTHLYPQGRRPQRCKRLEEPGSRPN